MMNESSDIRPSWMKLNPEIDHFDPFEGIGKLEEDEVRHLRYGINIGNQNLLFDKSILCEATINTNVYPIPNIPPWLNGMINLRGNPIPIFNIDNFVTDDKKEDRKNKIVFVIGEGSDAVGLLIDELPVAVEIDEENIESVSPPDNTPEIFSGAITNAYEVEKTVWLEIDIDTVIKNLKSHETTDLA
jgi:chemotaxis signal transduction protein